MQFKRTETNLTTDNTITTEHKGVELVWGIKTFRTLNVTPNLITDINKYWAGLPTESQDAIFDIYTKIHATFETVENIRVMDKYLHSLIRQLFEYHKFEDIMAYYKTKSEIKLPVLKDNYASDRDVPELTYLRNEYYGLIGLCIVMKIMVPIWGEYINFIANDVGTNFKEYRAARLLRGTNVTESEGYKRLSVYINAHWEGNTEKQMSAAILAGLDENQVPSWLLGNALVRRIATAELMQRSDPMPANTIITDVYNFIDSLSNTMDKHFGGRINEKSLDASGNDEDNTSVIENYKIKQELSEGVITMHDVYLVDYPEVILKKLAPECPVKLFKENMKLFESHYKDGIDIRHSATRLVQWVLHPVVTHKALDRVTYQGLLSAYVLTYTLLMYWGFDDLAIWLASKQQPTQAASNVVRLQITDAQLEQLNAIYPHAPNSTIKRRISKRDSNVAAVAISMVVVPIYSCWWKVPEWIDAKAYPELRIENGIMPVFGNIEIRLADLVIFLKTKVHNNLMKITRETK